jgi:membrane-associated phospholipid phosphatase
MVTDTRRVSRMQRRTALKLGAAATVAAGLTTGPVPAPGAPRAFAATVGGQVEPGAGSWKTWVLSSGSQLRLPPPPDDSTTGAEIDELKSLAARRDAAALDQIAYWDAGSPGYRWNEIACNAGVKGIAGIRNYRALALLNVAIYDAIIAAWDTKYAYNRPRPSERDPSLATVVASAASPAYPSEHAVAAGAASAVLAYLLPNDAPLFATLAEEAATSRLLAGVQYRSDVTAGLELGRAVAARVVEWAQSDGTDARWSGTVPTGAGMWQGDAPVEPLAGTWKTWTLSSGSQFRPGPPPAHDSEQMAAELDELKRHDRSANLNRVGIFWAQDPAGRPAGAQISTSQAAFHWAPLNSLLWEAELNQKLFEYRLDTNAPRAARAYALMSVAGYDAAVACWDAKYAYWSGRPIHIDPTVTPLFTTPLHPSYPSGHSTVVGASSTVLGYLFPRNAECFKLNAEEMVASRMWAGIHFRSDNETGLTLGRAVGQAVIERARGDGAGG